MSGRSSLGVMASNATAARCTVGGFTTIALPDRRAMKAARVSKARNALEPPVTLEIDESTVDGEPVIVAVVQELDPSQKPCRVGGGTRGGAWIRAWNGDYRASDLEIQGLLAARGQPRFDAAAVDGATRADLDETLADDFVRACRGGSEQLSQIGDSRHDLAE